MSKELITLERPKIPIKWDYEESVKKVKILIYKWKNLTKEVALELWVAREKLSKPGSHESGWGDYCESVGIDRTTAHRWLDRFFPPVANATGETPELPPGKYKVIYADPPWLYGQDQHGKEQQETVLSTHYTSLSTEELCKLPIKELAAENSVLFLWTTSPKLFEAKQVIDAWGFDYKASMVWDKIKHNVGYYVSVRHEFLLICTRGSCLPDSNKLHDSVVSIERKEHSQKPDIFYDIIEEMYQGKKIELFARHTRPGWSSWGNQL